jgi:hypothetical protein
VHRIFLKGPWELASSTGPVRVHLPRDWEQVLAQGGETLRLSRRFHRPTGLSEASKVFITVPSAWSVASLTVTGVTISNPEVSDDVQRYEITEPIRSRESHELGIGLLTPVTDPFFVAIEIAELRP